VDDHVRIDDAAWEHHAKWWEAEGPAARARMAVDDDTLGRARSGFGRIGSSTVRMAYADALLARQALGERLGNYAEQVAAHIRASLVKYRDAEAANMRRLDG